MRSGATDETQSVLIVGAASTKVPTDPSAKRTTSLDSSQCDQAPVERLGLLHHVVVVEQLLEREVILAQDVLLSCGGRVSGRWERWC